MKFTHTGTTELYTNNLILRQFNETDAESMLQNWISDPIIQQNYGEPIYETKADILELLRKWSELYSKLDFYRWAIILIKNNENIGQIAFCKVYSDIATAEIEYCIGRNYWGNGYANEALGAVINFAFECPKFLKIEAFHRNENINSGRVLQKSLMNVVPNVERFKRENKEPHDETCYAITNSVCQ